jgi:hypothetical protein
MDEATRPADDDIPASAYPIACDVLRAAFQGAIKGVID